MQCLLDYKNCSNHSSLMSIERQWHAKEYAEEIHTYLREKEQLRFTFSGSSPHLPARNGVVIWMLEVTERLQFCTAVKHLAVYLFDMFMDNHRLGNHLKLCALSCLIVAAKVEEDSQTPRNSTFNSYLGNSYRLSEFVEMETNILKFFKWEVMIPTAATFVEYYSLYILSQSDTVEGEPINFKRLKPYVQRYIDYFLKVTLLDVIFYKFAPSLVAAACILSTRLCLSVSPPWSLTLQQVTHYKYSHLKLCMEIMLRTLNSEIVMNIVAQVHDPTSVNNPIFVLQP